MNAIISEFQPNPAGGDPATVTIELSGTPGESFTGTLLSIENDGIQGSVDRLSSVSGTFDTNGLLTVTIDDLENPSFSLVLTDGIGSVALGDDLDANDDGTIDDIAVLGTVLDAIGVADSEADENLLYAAQLGGINFGFSGAEPELMFRSGSTGDWFAVNDVLAGTEVFDETGTNVGTAAFDTNPIVVDSFGAINPTFTPPASSFTLELLHVTDQEGSSAALTDIIGASAVLNALDAEDLGGDGQPDNTVRLSAGDAFIPGVFFDASEAVFGSAGIADILIQNEMGFQAIALGNHEFDLGTGTLVSLIDGSAPGTDQDGNDFAGTAFPYLSANLDFTADSFTTTVNSAGGQAPQGGVVTSSTILDVNGEQLAVVGATVPTLATISSPGTVGIAPVWASGTPTAAELDALAAIIQAEVDALLTANADLDKVVLASHMQQLPIEQELATRLSGVDIIIAGGSNTRLFDDNDVPRAGDSDQGQYPQFIMDLDGNPTALVNTDGSYKYVGRLVIDFDDNGVIIPSSYDADISGAYATDATGVAALGAEGQADEDVVEIVNLIEAEIIATEGNVFGVSNVFLNANRSGTFTADDPDGVRTQETNLGNLTADANLAYAKEFDPNVVVSIKNGGGIRANIGEIVVPAGGTEAVRQPNGALVDGNGVEIKPEGGISQTDIQSTLAFNNGLTLLDVTKAELVAVLEGAISALPGVSGGFPQVAGVKFSFDESQAAGERIVNAAIFDGDTLVAELVRDGEIVGDSTEVFRIVTLNFLANGGDGVLGALSNPNRVDLIDLDADGVDDELFTGAATFAEDGSEQDALAEYLNDNFNPANGGTAFAEADGGPAGDERIQNLAFRADTVLPDTLMAPQATLDVTFEVLAEFQGESDPTDDDSPEGASEVVAHEEGFLYVTNGNLDRIDVFQIPDPDAPVVAPKSIDLSGLDGYGGVQSVAVKNGVVAAAIARPNADLDVFGTTTPVTQPGFVAFFDATTHELLSTVDVGNLPDQIVFSEDRNTLLVAGEGEYNQDTIDDGVLSNPLGTVVVIDVTDPAAPDATILDFTVFNGLEELARSAGIRIQEGVSFAQDVEPEYIAISPDGTSAFVSLQENNAIARIDLASLEFNGFFSLGTQDFSEVGIDPNDDGNIDIRTFDNLVGLRMADAIASFEVGGQTFVATANEGDSRDFDESRVSGANIDPSVDTTGLERLEISTIDGDTDGDGDIDVIHTFSSRSFSIFDEDGNLVFDSGDDFERIIADLAPERFNDDDGDDGEDRSDAKGPEPEAITVGEVGGRLYAFIGLERDSGIMIYDISDPAAAFFVNYIPPLFTGDAGLTDVAKQGPEVIAFIAEDESTTGNAQIAVAYEISGTTVVYDLASANPITSIMEIQGAGHTSALEGQSVLTRGIVTAVDSNGFYMQDPDGDGDIATSDAIFVFTGSVPTVAAGDEVTVEGTVSEFFPGGQATGNLSTTQISGSPVVTVLSSGNALPTATIIGSSGRVLPNQNIDDDAFAAFEPTTDAIDFFESLEGMLVTAEDLQAIAPTNRFGEIFAVTNQGADATGISSRGTLNISETDFNPEKIQIDEDSGVFDFAFPEVDTGALLGDITGVVSYSFGNFEIVPTVDFSPNIVASTLTPEVSSIIGGEGELTVATYNVLNLDINDADGDTDVANGRFDAIAEQIVTNLNSPDIIGLQEVQDNSGSADDGTISASDTLQALVDAIAAAGGPVYAFIDNTFIGDNVSGGQPGGNIRTAFLYDASRVSVDPSTVRPVGDQADGSAFAGARLPLAADFVFDGERVTVVNNHFSSKGGSSPILGVEQDFAARQEEVLVNGSLDERRAQAQAVNDFVDGILATDSDANVIVLGDLNEFEFISPLQILEGTTVTLDQGATIQDSGESAILTNLVTTLPDEEIYSFIFQGNSQALDHILVTNGLLSGSNVDIVHVNTEFAETDQRASDHDPILASFDFRPEGETITGTEGRDRLTGTEDADVISALGARDIVRGNGGNDSIDGGSGGDFLFGGADDDIIVGGTGNDRLWGDAGADTFVFAPGDGRDAIFDFEFGLDRIDLSAFGFADLQSVLDVTQEKAVGVRILLGNGDQVFVMGPDKDELTASDFILV